MMPKNILKILGFMIVTSFIILLGANLYFSSISDFVDPWQVDQTVLSYFRETYEDSRDDFFSRCDFLSRSIPGIKKQKIYLASKKKSDLTIDICRVPSSRQDKLLIITTGLHGSEGYATSAVMRRMMDILSSKTNRPELLFIHGINPFGMKIFRRTTENNVDLNRNFEITNDLFSIKNSGYEEMNDFLNPKSPSDLTSWKDQFFALRAIFKIALNGTEKLRQAVLQGQYEYAKGIYFGGKTFEPQKDILEEIFLSVIRNRKVVLLVDLHTGYGERGKSHLFPNPPSSEHVRYLTEKVFAGYKTDWGDTKDFYTTYGDLISYVGKLMPPGTNYIPMALEYGTLNSQTTKGTIDSIHRMILENQSYFYGCVKPEDCQEIRTQFREMFYPSSPAWRSHIMEDSEKLFGNAVDRLLSIE